MTYFIEIIKKIMFKSRHSLLNYLNLPVFQKIYHGRYAILF